MSAAPQRRPHVVVVDDDVEPHRAEVAELEEAGFVLTVTTGIDEALANANATDAAPDCWLIGHRVWRRLTQEQSAVIRRENRRRAPILLLADSSDLADVGDALSDGVSDVVVKGPGCRELLAFRVRATIDGALTGRSLDEARTKADAAEAAAGGARDTIEHMTQADRRKDEFLALLGKELRTPLAPISNALEILRLTGAHSADARWATEVVGRQLAHLRRLVDDLSDVARIAQGRFQLAFAPLPLRDVVADAIDRSGAVVRGAGQQLTTPHIADHLAVYGDGARLEQALATLIGHVSAHAGASGHIDVAVAGRDGEASIVVTDDGAGLAPEELAGVFATDHAHERPAGKHGWFGTGLRYVRRVVELHGGRIDVTSRGEGKGTCFTIHLPLSRVAPSSVLPQHRRPVALPERTILVADGDVDAAESLARLLRLWGFAVHCVHDGESALRALREVRPHAVLLDVNLQGADRLPIARRLRDEPRDQRCLFVALSNARQPQAREPAGSTVFDRSLVKPATTAALRDCLAHLLRD